jgi:hypothetical protein
MAKLGWHGGLNALWNRYGKSPRLCEISCQHAAENGHISIIVELLQNSDEEPRTIFTSAAKGGFIRAMQFMVDLHDLPSGIVESAMQCATIGGHIHAMKYCRKLYTRNPIERLMPIAATHDQIRAMRLLKRWGVRNYGAAIAVAAPRAFRLLRIWLHEYYGVSIM